jgi:Na+-translocating ferredoxin:NAD+ oxidoreductase subunit A
MTNLLALLIGAVLVNQLLLVRFPAIWPAGADSQNPRLPPAATLVTTLALTTGIAIDWLIDARLLQAYDLRELRLLVLVIAIIAVVPLVTLLAGLKGTTRQQVLAAYRPLMTTNCVLLGAALLVSHEATTLTSAIAWAIATGAGFFAMLALFAELRDRLDAADIPAPFRGAAIALVTAGMMSLAFSGIATVARG